MLQIEPNTNNSVRVIKDSSDIFPETITYDDADYVYGTSIDELNKSAVYFKSNWLYN
jgi:hypothetical protein